MSENLPANHPSKRSMKSRSPRPSPRDPSLTNDVIRHASAEMTFCAENEDDMGWVAEFFERTDLWHPSWPRDVTRVCNYLPTSSFREWEISAFVKGADDLLSYFYEFENPPSCEVRVDRGMAPHAEGGLHHRSSRTDFPVETALYIMIKMVAGEGLPAPEVLQTRSNVRNALFGVLFRTVRPLCLRAEMEGDNDLRLTLSETPDSLPMVAARIKAENYLDEEATAQLFEIRELLEAAGECMREAEHNLESATEVISNLTKSVDDTRVFNPLLSRIRRFIDDPGADEAIVCTESIDDFIDSCVKQPG